MVWVLGGKWVRCWVGCWWCWCWLCVVCVVVVVGGGGVSGWIRGLEFGEWGVR